MRPFDPEHAIQARISFNLELKCSFSENASARGRYARDFVVSCDYRDMGNESRINPTLNVRDFCLSFAANDNK